MSANTRLSVSDTYYVTPLPSNDVEKKLWQLVIDLYGLTGETKVDQYLEKQSTTEKGEFKKEWPFADKVNLCFTPLRTYLDQLTVAYTDLRSPTTVEAAVSVYPRRQHLSRNGRLLISASVIEVAIQHPFAKVRRPLTSLLLNYTTLWNFDCCAPVAVAAGVGDVPIVMALLAESMVDPNSGFPLLIAVRRRQHEVVRVLLESYRVKPNYGGAFYEAVHTGNRAAVLLFLESSSWESRPTGGFITKPRGKININHFANNEGSTPLTNIIRQATHLYKQEYCGVPFEEEEGGALPDRGSIHYHSLASSMEMLYVLLSQPSIDVNKGYAMTPLQLAVKEGCLEIVQLLLLHPTLYPNSISIAADCFRESFASMRHHTFSAEELKGLVLPPLDLALYHRNPSMFSLLVHDSRLRLTERLQHQLERDPWQWDHVPFMEALAVLRPLEWEGWSWRWRRQCILWGSITYVVLSLCNLALWIFFSKDVLDSSLTRIFVVMYAVSGIVGIVGYLLQRKKTVHFLPQDASHHNGNNTRTIDTRVNVFHYLAEYLCYSDDNPRSNVSKSLVFFTFAIPPILPVAECIMFTYNSCVGQKRDIIEDDEERLEIMRKLIGRINTDWRRKKFYKGEYEFPVGPQREVSLESSPVPTDMSSCEDEPLPVAPLTAENIQQLKRAMQEQEELAAVSNLNNNTGGGDDRVSDTDDVNSLSFRIERSAIPYRTAHSTDSENNKTGSSFHPSKRQEDSDEDGVRVSSPDAKRGRRLSSPLLSNIRAFLAHPEADQYLDEVGEITNESFSRPLPAVGAARALRRLMDDVEEGDTVGMHIPSSPNRSRKPLKKKVRFNLIPATPTETPREVYRKDPNLPLLGECNYNVRDVSSRPNLVLRSCYFLLFSSLSLSRLCVSATCVFVYLLSLFPTGGVETDPEDPSTILNQNDKGLAEVLLLLTCAMGLICSIACGGIQLVVYLSLRRTDKGSLLSGRQNRRAEDEPFHSYLI